MSKIVFVVISAVIAFVNGNSNGLEPNIGTVLTTAPTSVVAQEDGSFAIQTSPIQPTPIGVYFATHNYSVPVFTETKDGQLVPGIVLSNHTDNLIPRYALRKPTVVYHANGTWKLRVLDASGSANLEPGDQFELFDSRECSVGVIDQAAFAGVVPISTVLGMQERPMFSVEYISADAPAWADELSMQYAIGLAVKTYLDLLDNEDDTPAYRFRFQWEQNNQLPGIELAQAQSLVEYADNN